MGWWFQRMSLPDTGRRNHFSYLKRHKKAPRFIWLIETDLLGCTETNPKIKEGRRKWAWKRWGKDIPQQRVPPMVNAPLCQGAWGSCQWTFVARTQAVNSHPQMTVIDIRTQKNLIQQILGWSHIWALHLCASCYSAWASAIFVLVNS